MHRPKLLFRITVLLLLSVLFAGCGRASEAAALPVPTPPRAAPHPEGARLAANRPVLTPDRMAIPRIHLETPVVELGWSTQEDQAGQVFSEWNVAAYAAGWHKNSARLGEPGNIVMSGHNNILGAVFRELDQLRRGDEISVWSGMTQTIYLVHDVWIVPEKYATMEQRIDNAKWIGPFDDDRLTLVSCWPRDDNTHRIIVVAFPGDGG
jgi:sortase A